MSHQAYLTRVEKVIRATVTFPQEVQLQEQTELYTLGIDSLTTINVLLALATDYQVELENFVSEIDGLKTVGDLCGLAAKFSAANADSQPDHIELANIKFFSQQVLHYEYGLDGIRTFPWENVNTPIGSGYCIVRPFTETLPHINQPDDEDELFLGIQGQALVVIDGKEYTFTQGDQVFIPRGSHHYVRNNSDQSFHFFTIWWNQAGARAYLAQEEKAEQ
ncbi:cupin domain-containing protein [Yersinia pseudotuberculosis]|uniref:Cupin domain-containing protein n=1 Tax=Yersinia pseudotuberculosis TaxID=633 RepID=Q6EVR6_YERPU|nr:cupin domain-containing protein [Yersinia pseudotuberculosis]AYW90815.1 cupin domain-containing protein [Yersinia pseudotuberculosis]MBO1632081.1 cupin domain-containing protein [Yersinia pseudotuberculosis]MBP0071752.1 cupin domain-containing protein [Yersinia pseudotuberculosis]CAF28542.1 putative acyl carrier-like protein [Yersinia pseudotuberculosis]CNE56052.1 Thermophilic glucose-6-phosphate isomerase and related metalloenzymes [Yersinia pseudotuberculosis]